MTREKQVEALAKIVRSKGSRLPIVKNKRGETYFTVVLEDAISTILDAIELDEDAVERALEENRFKPNPFTDAHAIYRAKPIRIKGEK